MSSEGRVAVVTGASHGIGRVVAASLAASGYRVAAAARTTSQLDELAGETGCLPVELDVTDAGSVGRAIDHVESELGPIDLLVNNAGVAGAPGVSWAHEPADWWRVFEVNVLGLFLCSRAVLPAMTSRGSGRIVNVSSNAAFFEVDDAFAGTISSAYMASKAGVIRLTEALAAEARPSGVHVFAISPGTVKTEMTAEIFADEWDDPDLWTPPERTAELVAFIESGALDSLSGRYIHARTDDWQALADRSGEIRANDLHALRLRVE